MTVDQGRACACDAMQVQLTDMWLNPAAQELVGAEAGCAGTTCIGMALALLLSVGPFASVVVRARK